jgi:hypothetical protein
MWEGSKGGALKTRTRHERAVWIDKHQRAIKTGGQCDYRGSCGRCGNPKSQVDPIADGGELNPILSTAVSAGAIVSGEISEYKVYKIGRIVP